MNSLNQYLELYKTYSGLVDSGSCPVMNRLRNEARLQLQDRELPRKGSENYELIDLNEILSPDFGLNLSRLAMSVDKKTPFHCGVPNMTKNLFFLQNDIYTETKDCRQNLPEGLYINSLRNFCEEYPSVAERYYGHLADIQNPLVALNTLLCQDGIVLWVKEGVKYDRPIQIVGILENNLPLMVTRRILVIAEKNSEVKLLVCDHTQTAGVKFMNLVTTEIYAEENASVEICEMEESTEQTSRLSATYICQDADSHVSSVGITLFNGITRNEYYGSFSGKNAFLSLSGMGIEDRTRVLDYYSVVEHTLPGCHTDELFKFVVDEEAKAIFSGLIRVFKGASKTEAYQNNRNLIVKDGARVFSKPRLEIYEDDVKCSHGTAIGQLDPMQIFYMRTRGLSEDQARFLLKQAFMADVIDRVTIPDFQMRLHNLVERRFAGDFQNCAFCQKKQCEND